MRIIFLLAFLCAGFTIAAQNRCVMSAAASAWLRPGETAKKANANRQITDDAIIRIPVVVHVIYNTPEQNISIAQITSGIEALNRDFRRKNADTVNTPQRFRHLAADVQIEFYLATADPFGRKTAGVVRKQTTRNGWMPDDKMKLPAEGGDAAWDSKQYLNIWIANIIGGSGYSSLPGASPATDGVVINGNSFGTINTVAPFNMGRTAVHEVGHWLGLKHIWGDTQCGDDGVGDTPQQGFFTQGCPTGFRSSCNNGETGDMYMNYMDYTNDACMNLFTQGQRTVMRSQFTEGGWRAAILQSRGLNEPWAVEAQLPGEAALYPNPAYDNVTIQVSDEMIGKQLSLYNSQGQLHQQIMVNALRQTINVANLKPGVYFLKGEGFSQKFIKL